MRRAVAALVALAVCCLPAAASAHPGHPYEDVVVNDFQLAPATQTILAGQLIRWTWAPSSIARSRDIVSDTGSGENFNGSFDPSKPGFFHRFNRPGTYGYHATGLPELGGTIVVKPLPGEPPKLSRLRVAGGAVSVARFRLSKRGDLFGRIQARRNGNWETRKLFQRRGKAGANSHRLPVGSLGDGTYRLKLAVYDLLGRRDTATARFTLR